MWYSLIPPPAFFYFLSFFNIELWYFYLHSFCLSCDLDFMKTFQPFLVYVFRCQVLITWWFSKYHKSLFGLLQSVLADWWIVHFNLTIRFLDMHYVSTLTQVLLSLNSINSIWKNKLSNPRKRITNQSARNTNPWERIPNPREWIIRFEITIYFAGCFFLFWNHHSPSIFVQVEITNRNFKGKTVDVLYEEQLTEEL